jgi:hypothetical protein
VYGPLPLSGVTVTKFVYPTLVPEVIPEADIGFIDNSSGTGEPKIRIAAIRPALALE